MVYEAGVLPNSEIFDIKPGALSRRMGLNVVRAGIFECDSRYCVTRENYGSYLLLFTRSGNGIIDTNDTSFRVKEGDFALIDCYHRHSYRTDSRWNFDWVHVEGNVVDQFYKTVASMKRNHVFSAPKNLGVVHTMDQLLSQLRTVRFNQNCNDEAKILCCLMEIFGRLLSISAPVDTIDVPQDPIARCIEYIHRNLSRNIQITDLAALVNYSPYYFIRRFTREAGVTPYEYIKNLRIDRAKQYLRTTNMPVNEIGRLCGFSKGNNFSTAFRLATNETPTSYREKYCQSDGKGMANA